jgi:hypothetical protein
MKKFWLATMGLQKNIVSKPGAFIYRIFLLIFYRLTTLKRFSFLLVILFSTNIYAQSGNQDLKDAEYKKVITERVVKIINPLELKDSVKYHKILSIVVNQYLQVNAIQDKSKEKSTAIKSSSLEKEEKEKALKEEDEKKSRHLLQQHETFIDLLKNDLSDLQINKIKDGMTYSVFPKTYAAYVDMIPSLKQEQKDKIYNWLKEARELAMDEGSSERKHAVFGKYKGRINNYLSAEGYVVKKEGEEWQKRIKEKNNQTNKQ